MFLKSSFFLSGRALTPLSGRTTKKKTFFCGFPILIHERPFVGGALLLNTKYIFINFLLFIQGIKRKKICLWNSNYYTIGNCCSIETNQILNSSKLLFVLMVMLILFPQLKFYFKGKKILYSQFEVTDTLKYEMQKFANFILEINR